MNDYFAMESIRQASIETARSFGYPINPNLPLVDESEVIRSVAEIVCRIFAMHCAAAAAYGFDRHKAKSWLVSEACENALTDAERDFLESGQGDRQQFAIQVEAIFALTWAVSIVPTLDSSNRCPHDFVHKLPNLKTNQSGQEFRNSAELRSAKEILAATDLAYCLHWAIADAQLKGVKIPGKVEAYVVVERRRALEWLLAVEQWDDIPLDT